VRVY